MTRVVARRLIAILPTVVGITLVAFAIARSAPGDPLAMQGDLGLRAGGATLQQMREYRRLMGLDEPIVSGYLRWIWQLLHGDLGSSFRDGRPVLVLLKEALPITLLLSVASLVIGYLLAVPVGILSAAKPGGWFDRASSGLFFALYSMPVQWVALLLVLCPTGLPIHGLHSEGERSTGDLIAHLALPVAWASSRAWAARARRKSRSNGLGTKSSAPAFIASTATVMLATPETMITGAVIFSARSRRTSSTPFIPGRS